MVTEAGLFAYKMWYLQILCYHHPDGTSKEDFIELLDGLKGEGVSKETEKMVAAELRELIDDISFGPESPIVSTSLDRFASYLDDCQFWAPTYDRLLLPPERFFLAAYASLASDDKIVRKIWQHRKSISTEEKELLGDIAGQLMSTIDDEDENMAETAILDVANKIRNWILNK